MHAAIMHSLPFPSIYVNNGQIVDFNKNAASFINKTCIDLSLNQARSSPPQNNPLKDMLFIDALLKGKELLAEYVTLNHQGKPFSFIASTVVVKDSKENMAGVYGSFMHVPQKKMYKYQVISALAKAIASKCPYTKSHSNRVAHLSLYIGRLFKLPHSQLKLLFSAALLHDIGKIGISEHILNKEGALTEQEFQSIRQHPVIGTQIINPISFLKPLSPIVLHHHEHFDGKGYPHGLKGEQIPFLSRIVSVADAFEAMNFDRCYRKKMPFNIAVKELSAHTGTQFDPHIVKKFISAIMNEPHPGEVSL